MFENYSVTFCNIASEARYFQCSKGVGCGRVNGVCGNECNVGFYGVWECIKLESEKGVGAYGAWE